MVEGQKVSVVEHARAGGSKWHADVSLFEMGHGKISSDGVVLGKTRGGRKGAKEGLQHGLHVRKPPDLRTISRPVLNEWVDTMNMQINAIAAHSEHDPGCSTRAVVNQDGGLEPVVLMNTKQGVQMVIPDTVLGGEGRSSIAD
ncbi:hypothetical protein V6N13_135018 [Hibiscus sabdariffa]|uniref:Uncharacterized protein n=1 Tax=Hibiscus sabdariffa TaxID=183260 RepID=A0ABR2R5P3_9ROSI